jgi:hypothetical protein
VAASATTQFSLVDPVLPSRSAVLRVGTLQVASWSELTAQIHQFLATLSDPQWSQVSHSRTPWVCNPASLFPADSPDQSSRRTSFWSTGPSSQSESGSCVARAKHCRRQRGSGVCSAQTGSRST